MNGERRIPAKLFNPQRKLQRFDKNLRLKTCGVIAKVWPMSFAVGFKIIEQVPITDQMVRQFANLSGDHNPIHLDDEFAKTTRFGRRIAHGMISGALISRVLGMQLGPGGIYLGQTLKFTHPLFIGDTAVIEVTVLQKREEKGLAIIETLVKNQNGEICVKGEATIMMKEAVKS